MRHSDALEDRNAEHLEKQNARNARADDCDNPTPHRTLDWPEISSGDAAVHRYRPASPSPDRDRAWITPIFNVEVAAKFPLVSASNACLFITPSRNRIIPPMARAL